MKIYIVVKGYDYEGYDNMFLTSSKEKAEEIEKTLECKMGYTEIQEWVLEDESNL